MDQVYEDWRRLVRTYLEGELDYTVVRDLHDWTDDDLLFARTYIGRELSRRAMSENPNATETLL